MVKISNKRNGRSVTAAALWSVAVGVAIQIIGALVCTNLLLSLKIAEGDMGGVIIGVRIAAIVSSAILAWIISGEDKLLGMIASCAGMIVLWFIAALGFAGVRIHAHLVNAIICVVIYGAVFLIFPRLQNPNRKLRIKSRYR